MLDAKDPFGSNVLKNPGRLYIHENFKQSTPTFLPFSFHNNLKEDTAFRCIGVKHLN